MVLLFCQKVEWSQFVMNDMKICFFSNGNIAFLPSDILIYFLRVTL